MNKPFFLLMSALAISFNCNAQSRLDSMLNVVEKNNQVLNTNRQMWEARKLEYNLGLTLQNPTIQGQYLIGSPTAAGNQTDFFAVQPFDFPTTYQKKKELAKAQGGAAISDNAAIRQEVLLQAKLICLEMIYRNRLSVQYALRKTDLEGIRNNFQVKLQQGDGTILDLNKTQLKLLELNQLLNENELELQNLQNRLAGINGGQMIEFKDTIYPPTPVIGAFEDLERDIETSDPIRLSLEQEKLIAEKQAEVAKTWRLPKFEAGYHYQAILGQRFNGVHLGLTIPVWEQKNRSEQARAELSFADLQIEIHRNEHFYEVKEQYGQQVALKKSLDDYRTVLNSSSNIILLDKALRLGEISTIEYFLELSFYQSAFFHFMKMEFEYQIVVAKLLRHQL